MSSGSWSRVTVVAVVRLSFQLILIVKNLLIFGLQQLIKSFAFCLENCQFILSFLRVSALVYCLSQLLDFFVSLVNYAPQPTLIAKFTWPSPGSSTRCRAPLAPGVFASAQAGHILPFSPSVKVRAS